MSEPEDKKIIVRVRSEGVEHELEGDIEDIYIRFQKRILGQFSSIRELLRKENATLNNVWGIQGGESGESLVEGQELRAKVRIGRGGAYAIAATTVVLGVVVAIRTAKQRHHE